MATNRNPYWDTIKAILICLVVLGHTGTALDKGLLSVIYAFHMPLFVFVSGYFSKQKDVKTFWGGVKRLIIIYLVFDLLYVGLDVILGESLSVRRLLTPSFALWYILSLVIWKSMLQFIPTKWLEKRWLIITVSFVIALGAGFVPIDTEMSFQRTCVFFPFFMLGFYTRDNNLVQWCTKKSKLIWCTVFVGLAILSYTLMPVFYGFSHYVGERDIWIRVIQLAIALAMCLALLGLIPSRLGKFTDLGHWTLLIYLLHPPIIKLSKMACSRVGIPMSPNVLMALIITVFCITAIYSVRKWKIFKYLS